MNEPRPPTNQTDVNAESVTQSHPDEVEFQVNPPDDGDIHGSLFKEALRLRKLGVPEKVVLAAMKEDSLRVWKPRRQIPEREIEGAVEDAFSKRALNRRILNIDDIDFRYNPQHGWPEYMPAITEKMDENIAQQTVETSEVQSVLELQRRGAAVPSQKELLKLLYMPSDLLCCGLSSNYATIDRFDLWLNGTRLDRMQFIVPNPMRGEWGTNRLGKTSRRCRGNVGPRRYLVVEMDKKCLSKDNQAAILWLLSSSLPLIMVVDSGNKSLHGWFHCEDVDSVQLRDWFRAAIILGADWVTWKPEQYVRMPGGTRYDDNLVAQTEQAILYFNPLSLTPSHE